MDDYLLEGSFLVLKRERPNKQGKSQKRGIAAAVWLEPSSFDGNLVNPGGFEQGQSGFKMMRFLVSSRATEN